MLGNYNGKRPLMGPTPLRITGVEWFSITDKIVLLNQIMKALVLVVSDPAAIVSHDAYMLACVVLDFACVMRGQNTTAVVNFYRDRLVFADC